MSSGNKPRSAAATPDWRENQATFVRLAGKAMRAAARAAIAEHHRAGRAVPIWRDGKIVMLAPDGSIKPYRRRRAKGGT